MGVGSLSLSPRLATGAFPGSDASASALLSTGCGLYPLTQSQALYHSASLGHSARRPSFCSDDTNEEANVHANIDVATRHTNVCASAVMTDDDDDDNADDSDFLDSDTLGEILLAKSMATPALDHDLAFFDVDSNVDFDRTPLLSPPSLPPPPLTSPPSSAQCFWEEHLRSFIIIFSPFWWLPCNKKILSRELFLIVCFLFT